MDISKKKIFILNKLYDTKYHNETINFIITNNIKYTENNNSILINLSVLNDYLVNKLYDMLINDNFIDNTYMYQNEKNNDSVYEINNDNNNDTNNNNNNIQINNSKEIILNDFTEDEKKLILLSKKYKFE